MNAPAVIPLCLPPALLHQHLVVLGKTGAGKSTALRHLVEHLLLIKKRVCIVDPKGDWHGLKVGADGVTPGFPVVAFGDFKDSRATDIPIHAQAGEAVATLIAEGNRPALIGLRGWMPAQLTRFWIDFASTLFNSNAGELYLIIDEVHNFAAKGKIMDPLAGQCLHWTNRLMSEGRGNGIVAFIASQRPQKVHNDTLTCCETLVSMRAVHKTDRQATADWIEGCGDGKSGKDILDTLASLERGEAWVWSPENSFGPRRVRFPKFSTFDSFAPPQVQPKVAESGWAEVDLDHVRAKMAEAENKLADTRKTSDPRILTKEVARLQTELEQLRAAPPVSVQSEAVTLEVQVPAFTAEDQAALHRISEALGQLISRVTGDIEGLRAQIETTVKEAQGTLRDLTSKVLRLFPENSGGTIQRIPKVNAPIFQASPQSSPHRQAPQPGVPRKGPTKLSGAARALLAVIVYRHRGDVSTTQDQVAVKAGYAATSGHIENTLGALRSAGYIEGNKHGLTPTPAGIKALGAYSIPLQGRSLIEHWLGKSPEAEKRMLGYLTQIYPKTIARDELATRTGYAISSGHVDNSLGHLRSLCLVVGNKHALSASAELMQP